MTRIARRPDRLSAPGAARTIRPEADDVAGGEAGGGIGKRRFAVVEEHLAALERGGGAGARAGTAFGGEIFVEPDAGVGGIDDPLGHDSAAPRHAARLYAQ